MCLIERTDVNSLHGEGAPGSLVHHFPHGRVPAGGSPFGLVSCAVPGHQSALTLNVRQVSEVASNRVEPAGVAAKPDAEEHHCEDNGVAGGIGLAAGLAPQVDPASWRARGLLLRLPVRISARRWFRK